MKKIAEKIILFFGPALLIFLGLFFDRKRLSGRFFGPAVSGYVWAFRSIWQRSILRLAKPLPFPACLGCYVSKGHKIHFHPDDLNNFQTSGTYFQNFSGDIYLGKGCYIAPNVGIITANHDPNDLDSHLPGEDVVLGEKCWIGMNSVILPGVTLGPNTIVGAGTTVTKSFPDGHCIIAGSPAKVIKTI
nr:acyltransferase [uncultured Shimia sp.]